MMEPKRLSNKQMSNTRIDREGVEMNATNRAPACPKCASPAQGEPIVAHVRGVATAHYLCLEGHAWIVRWMEAA